MIANKAVIRALALAALATSCLVAGQESQVIEDEAKLLDEQQAASQCDVSVSRSECGALTRIQSGDSVALVLMKQDTTWTAYTVNNGQVKVISSADNQQAPSMNLMQSSTLAPLINELADNEIVTSPKSLVEDGVIDSTSPMTDAATAEDEASYNKTEFDQLMARKLIGVRFSFSAGKLTIESTNGQKNALRSPTETAQVMLYGDCRSRTMAALNLRNQTLGYSHVFQQNGTVTTFVDQQCQLTSVPFMKLNFDQASLLGSMVRQAENDNRHHHHHHHHHMPPPPPPQISFFARMNPMNFFRNPQQAPLPQQFNGMQPPQFNMQQPARQ